ncbi:flagellar filament core protein flaB2 domain protein [Leptospira sp. 201903075]|uniref:flagellar filament core protein flaB2 domain protein n=1 Tax=Leptospira chreensis TaxID=2810035 RepID=UPI0019644D0C|nr:flagellar filament core protein flaB2 domain protein [Leptospira chreensis]MBM9591114.1 flagellar filament core protein flaB2 domain protein [Leptospira chreensis]
MKLPFNFAQSIDSQREAIIQKQIHKIRKEIFQWEDQSEDQNSEPKEISLRTHINAYSYFWTRVERNSTSAIDSRLQFLSLTANSLERLYQSQAVKTTFQKQTFLIKKSLVYLDTLLAISNRLSAIAQSKVTKKSSSEDLQGEVAELIDEVDRIASLAEFRHMRLFEGAFAKSSRTASMWFINEKTGGLYRMYIATMTARSLGLTTPGGYSLTLSNPILLQKKIKDAITRITEERKRIQSVLD